MRKLSPTTTKDRGRRKGALYGHHDSAHHCHSRSVVGGRRVWLFSKTLIHNRMGLMHNIFRKVAHTVSEVTGSPWAFILAVAIIATWALTGPIFGFSDTWQL